MDLANAGDVGEDPEDETDVLGACDAELNIPLGEPSTEVVGGT